ncbi:MULTISPECIES: FAD-binding oxidoreductase [unclassified Acidovorax]|uniref:FAD-binding oxidoreductase n=1 Tax=unclassified Acidovorax TaxID=2684926 RepID=UPI0006FB1C53|nr:MULTISPECIES: FAD-binding oxidoreductase [unclassified Acidovorax]KRB34684.1 hydroxyacid dehydrogenase [Acidovorax sp. Root70]PUA97276.1 FAD/FMN-containing dehydrogenase [Acidovorax sp. 107]
MATELHTALRAAFAGRLFTEAEEMAPFLTDWRGKWTGTALAVVQPDSPQDVASVMRWCHERRIPVVPQGGNTGLSGGATPDASGRSVVLSLSRLQSVRSVDLQNNTITVDAGVTLLALQEAAQAQGRMFPLSLAAEGSCTIGGNLASNAGGVQVLRYGNARELCLGLEVVTAEGELWNGLRGLRKDNTGYDLRDLYIGSEGTLGIITGATLKLFPQPRSQVVACVAVPAPAQAVELLTFAQARLGAALTAFELMSDTCLQLVEKHVPGSRIPFGERSPWYVLMELSGEMDDTQATSSMESLLEAAFEQSLITDAAPSSSLSQLQALWALRENISEAQGAEGKTIKHDISLPASRIAEFIESTDAGILAQSHLVRLVVFGHLGDGNLHYNLSPAEGSSPADFLALEPAMNRLIHDAVHARGGSISAEHGLGVLRRDESARYKSPVELDLMRRIKAALDPHGLLNPGKLLP